MMNMNANITLNWNNIHLGYYGVLKGNTGKHNNKILGTYFLYDWWWLQILRWKGCVLNTI